MKQRTIAKAARAAFPYTLPILACFLFIGAAFGIYMKTLGFSPLYPILMSVFIFAGAMQFVAAGLLVQPFAPVSTLVATLIVNARHVFYGMSMLEKYGAMGKKKIPVIFWMCDETFSINCGAEIPPEVDRGWFYFFVSLLDYSYWIIGTALGALGGELLPFDTTGIDFVVTDLFLVIFMSQWEKEKSHVSGVSGLVISAVCLALFGPDGFILPAMVGILLFLTILRRPMERRLEV